MAEDDICYLTAAELGRRIRRRELTSVAVTEAYLGRIERLNPVLEAYVTVTTERALEEAQRADREIEGGHWRGQLHGVPYCLKDIIATKGIRTTVGSYILSDWVPDEDAEVQTRLEAAGSVLLGKVNTHEFAFGATTQNQHGRTKNPWNLGRIPGGSSGGSGAALAAGLAAFSVGSDTAGSIRLPAAFCGIAGLKPTWGLVSTAGVVAQSFTADHVGPMARSVEDLPLLMAVLADPFAEVADGELVDPRLFCGVGAASLEGLKVGIPRELMAIPLDEAVAAGFERQIALLEAGGAVVREVSVPLLGRATAINNAIVPPETMAHHLFWQKTWFEGREIRYGDDVAKLLAGGAAVAGTTTILAQRDRDRLRQEIASVLETDVDVLITPTQAVPATAPGQETALVGGETLDLLSTMIHFLCGFSLSGMPALALPAGFSADGLPVSVQLVGPSFQDARLLSIGMALERAAEAPARLPPL